MNNSIIEDIFLKRRGHIESVKYSKEYVDISSELVDLYDNLIKTLNEEQKKQLVELADLQVELETEAAFCYYKDGLKVGLLLISECCQD